MFIESRRIGPWKSIFTSIGLAVAFPFIFVLESLEIITSDELKKTWQVITAPVDWKACRTELKDKGQGILCLAIILAILPYFLLINWIGSRIIDQDEDYAVNAEELRNLIKNPNFIKE